MRPIYVRSIPKFEFRRDGETSKIHAITYSVLQERPKIIHGVIDMIYETLKKLNYEQRKQPSYIFLDENNQVKEIPLSKLDSAGAYMIRNPAKLIHKSILGY